MKHCSLVINFQSIHNENNKIEDLLHSINNSDVIIGTESWLNNEIFPSEILQNIYKTFSVETMKIYTAVC